MPSARSLAAQLPRAAPGSQVRLEGWVHRRRVLATVTFLVMRDRSGLAQVVVRDRQALPGEETVISVTGVATRNPDAPGGVEVTEPRITLLSEPALPPPVDLWRPTLDAGLATILDHAAVSWRHPARRARWQLAAASLRGFRAALDAEGFTEIQTPKFVSSATESGANVFRVDYFGRPAYLAQSPQFYKQTMVGVFERVYETGPVFRAEPHDTARHLAEYVSLDAELGFIADHRDVLSVLRHALAGMASAVRASPAADLLGIAIPDVPEEIPVIHFTRALELAGASPDEPDLAPAHERAVGQWAAETHGSDFVAVEGYPMRKRPFYTHPQPGDGRWSNSFDLLFRGVELVTGGQRLHRHSDYVAAILARGEDPAAYADYLEAFAHGMPPHGGFAIGLERWIARLTRAENIRDVTLFPRDLHRLTPLGLVRPVTMRGVDDARQEVPLRGGHNPGVVRAGATVRRPLKPGADRIHRLLSYFERCGFTGAPRFLGVDERGREILSFIEGFAPPHNGFWLSEDGVRAGARLIRRVHDLTAGTEFAAGSEVACHPNLSQPNFIFRDMIPVAIIDWDGTHPGTRLANFADFLWAFVHPGMYEDETAARMLRIAADAYGWSGPGLVDAMLASVRFFAAVVAPGPWAQRELADLERNADLFRARLPP